MTDVCFEKAIQTLYEIQTAESLHLEEQTKNTEISFSEKFETQMRKLIHRREKPYYVLINTAVKRVAVIILAAVITFATTTIGIANIYQPFADFIMEVFDDHTLFRPNRNNQSGDPLAEWKAYTPSYIPEGFEVTNQSTDDYSSFIRYSNEKGKNFRIIQAMAGGAGTSLDTEGVEGEYINVNGTEIFYYENKDENHLFFKKGVTLIFIHGNISKDELLKIAVSMRVKSEQWVPYVPSYIPEGFEISESMGDLLFDCVEYSNSDGKFLKINQDEYGSGSRISIDSEGVAFEEISVNGVYGLYCEKNNEKIIRLIFEDSDTYLCVSGNIEKEELFKVAESLEVSSGWVPRAPNKIPQGFELTYETRDWEYIYSRYSSDEKTFFIEQFSTYNGHISIDTEGTSVKDIYIDGIKAIYYENKGENTILFFLGDVCIIIQGNIDQSELINIALSLKIERE